MKKKAICLALACVMLLALVACGSTGPAPGPSSGATPSSAAPQTQTAPVTGDTGVVFDISKVDTSDWKKLELSYATYLPAENPNVNLCFTNWQKKLDELMPGYIKLTIYPSSTLLAQADIFEGVMDGVADLGMVDLSTVTELLPLCSLWPYPSTHVGGTPSASAAFQEWYNILQPEELDDVVVLHLQANSSVQMVSSFDWNKYEDLTGKQLRATAALAPTLVALGAVPVTLATSEIYEAARSGLIDGAYYTITSASLLGATEFLKYGVFMNMGTSPYAYVMNKDVFASMPETQQAFFKEAFSQAFWELIIPAIPEIMDQHQPTLADISAGKIICKSLSDAEYQRMFDKVAYLREDYMKSLEAKGVKDVREAAKQLDELTAKWNKWFPASKYQAPFFAAMEGKYEQFKAETWGKPMDPYPEIFGYTPVADR